jgi:hypothetical protein
MKSYKFMLGPESRAGNFSSSLSPQMGMLAANPIPSSAMPFDDSILQEKKFPQIVPAHLGNYMFPVSMRNEQKLMTMSGRYGVMSKDLAVSIPRQRYFRSPTFWCSPHALFLLGCT